MKEVQLIQSLILNLDKAAAAKDWGRVQHVDRQIAQLLSSLKDKPVTHEVEQALSRLSVLHRQVYELCEQRSQEVAEKMWIHRNNQEGLNAYAMFTPDEVE